MIHAPGCRRMHFSEDPPPLDRLWWHSAFCEGKIAVEEFSDETINKRFAYFENGIPKKGLYISDGMAYGKCMVALIWSMDERSKQESG